jgi:hypothetical protein
MTGIFFSSEIFPLNQFIVAMISSEFTETSYVPAAFSSVEDEYVRDLSLPALESLQSCRLHP